MRQPAGESVSTINSAPAPRGKLADRWNTGPNAQGNWTANAAALKTGQNAQTDLSPNLSQLKTGPNAQTDLRPNVSLLKSGLNAQTDLTLKSLGSPTKWFETLGRRIRIPTARRMQRIAPLELRAIYMRERSRAFSRVRPATSPA